MSLVYTFSFEAAHSCSISSSVRERKEDFSSSMRDLFQMFYRIETWQLKKDKTFSSSLKTNLV